MASKYPTVPSNYLCIKCGQKNDHWIMSCNISKFTTMNRLEHLVMGYMTKQFPLKNRYYQRALNTVVMQFITNIFIDLLPETLKDIANKDSIWVFKYLSAIISNNEQQQINEMLNLNNTQNFNLSNILIGLLWHNNFDIRHGAYSVFRHYIPLYGSNTQLPTIRDPTLRALKMLIKLPEYIHGCNSRIPGVQFENTQKIRKLLSSEIQAMIQFVIDAEIVPRFIQFLKHNNFPQLQFEAAWCLTNIAAGTSEQIAVVVKHGALPILINLIQSHCYEVQEQAIWALGNIAGDSVDNRNLVLRHNILENMLKLCGTTANTNQQTVVLRNLTWTLSNLCRGIPAADSKYIILLIEALAIMMKYSDDEILQDCCWAYSYLSDSDEHINGIMNSNVMDKLIMLLEHASAHIRHPALRTISNIIVVAECDKYYENILVKVLTILTVDRPNIKREAFVLVSNIAAESQEQVDKIISANLTHVLVGSLTSEGLMVAKEALWAISNMTSVGSDAQIRFLVNQGVIAKLCSCEFFKKQISDRKVLMKLLEIIENILIVGDNNDEMCNRYAEYFEEACVVDWLEQLQSNEEIIDSLHDKANAIVKRFFD